MSALGTKDFWKLFGIGFFCLLVSAWIVSGRLKASSSQIRDNRALLHQTAPGFSRKTIPALKDEITDLQARLYASAVLFNPQERWLRKGYDVSILFVEELNNANEFLKKEAAKMQVEFPEFSFQEKLPNEKEAAQLLTQLYGIREVLNSAIEQGADVIDVKPLKVSESEVFIQGVILPSRLEFRFPHATVTEFLISITGIVPKITIDSLEVKVLEAYVELIMDFSTVYTDFSFLAEFTQGSAERHSSGVVPEESFPAGVEAAISRLRSLSPFAVPVPKEEVIVPGVTTEERPAEQQQKPVQRFLFRGRATLHGKDIAVIEDTLRQETVFLSRGEVYERFILKDFSQEGAILEGSDNQIITIINEEERHHE